MNIQEQTNRIKQMMGIINESIEIDWESMPSKQLRKRNPNNEIIFLSPQKIYDRLATDNPDLDIRNNPSLRIGDRLEKSKKYLENYITDPYDEPEQKDYFFVDGDWKWLPDPRYERTKTTFQPTEVYLDRYNLNREGQPSVGISDGRHRLLAALELGMNKFPIEVSVEDKQYLESKLR